MKVCTKCGEINKNTDLICINCNSSNKYFIDYDEATLITKKKYREEK